MRRTLLVLTLALVLAAAACGGDDESAQTEPTTTTTTEAPATTEAPTTTEAPATTTTATPTTTTTAAPDPLVIVVTNDDGIGAEGIDVLVAALDALANVEIAVVAPAENASGSSDTTTDGEVTWTDGTTAGGFAGVSVAGFPADSVLVALDELGLEPDLVVSGVNSGQNVGPFAALSGTVGAARTAARNGVPAVAVSAGIGDSAGYPVAAALAADWIDLNREAIEEGLLPTDSIVSFNVPACTAGEIGELIATELAVEIPDGVSPFETDCSLEPPAELPGDDVGAIVAGFATQTIVPVDL